jgi:hypothetical protein
MPVWDAGLRGALRERAARLMDDNDLWHALGIAPTFPADIQARFPRRNSSVTALQVLALVEAAEFAVRHGPRQVS